MSIQVITPPRTTDLTTVAAVKGDLPPGTTFTETQDEWLEDRIHDASLAIAEYCDRVLTRRRVRERFSGTGRMQVVLTVAPIARLEALTNRDLGDQDVTEMGLGLEPARIEDKDAGFIWRRGGFPDESPVEITLQVNSLPEPGERTWQAQYLGGWLTRADDIMASGVTASGSDLTLPSGRTPLLASGDDIVLRGWPTNNGHYLVTAVTDLTITIDGTLATETGTASSKIVVKNVPSLLERACIDTVKTWYYQQSQNLAVTSERIGDWSATYGSALKGQTMDSWVLPSHVLLSIERYRRLA